MNRLPNLLLLAALLLVGVGVVLALVQPFGLGDEDAGTEAAQPDVTETETETETTTDDVTDTDTDAPSTTDPDTTATTSAAVPGDDTDDTTPTTSGETATTSAPATTTPTTPPAGSAGTSGGGSGLDGEAALPADLEDGLADTGGTSVVGAALLVGLAGLALRRRLA